MWSGKSLKQPYNPLRVVCSLVLFSSLFLILLILVCLIYGADGKHPFIKRASYNMLGSIPAPPALASEFPAKEAALRLHSAAQSSSSVHFTAGMIRIRNMTLTGNGMDWSLGKNDDVNLILSFVLPQGDMNSANSVPLAGSLTGKGSSVVSRCWCFFLFFWFLILSVSFKIGSYIYIK